MPSAEWAIGHLEKLIDFGYRALHKTALASKKVPCLPRKTSGHAYFMDCSDGGRVAMMAAQRYPEDFDDIIAGAPASHWTQHFTRFLWNEQALNAKPESQIPTAKLSAIQKAALAQCDGLANLRNTAPVLDPTGL
jgi:feruloyl esterase